MKKEVSVEHVANRLSVSERSVVNYLKTRRIEGIKVGKKWFIDSASVDAFAQRYGFTIKPIETGDDAKSPALTRVREEKPGRSPYSLQQLHIFRLCVEVFTMNAWVKTEALPLDTRLQMLKNRVFEEVGAGFYSYGMAKKSSHYNNARAENRENKGHNASHLA